MLKRHLIDREIDLKEAVRGVGVGVTENSIGQWSETRMWLMVFVEAARDLAGLTHTEEERLIFTSVFTTRVEVINNS